MKGKSLKRTAGLNPNSYLFARYQGFSDGRLNIPTADQGEPSQYESDIIDQVDEYTCILARELTEKVSQFTRAISERVHREGVLREKLHKANLALAGVQEENRLAQHELREREHPHLRPWMVWPVIGVLALTEVPLNSFVFSLFGAQKMETYLMASGLCFAIPWVAHLAGQESRLREQRRLSAKFWVLSSALVIFLIAISYLRTVVMGAMATDQALNIRVSGVWSGATFFFANFIIVGAAYWTAYAGQVENPQAYKSINDRAKRATAGLADALRERDALERELFTLIRNSQDAASGLVKYRDSIKSWADACRSQGRRSIRIYRRTNIRWRKDNEKVIARFAVEPGFPEPACLTSAYQEADHQIRTLESAVTYSLGTENLRIVVEEDGDGHGDKESA